MKSEIILNELKTINDNWNLKSLYGNDDLVKNEKISFYITITPKLW